MVDRPILFSGPMIQALVSGRKTQTRRALPPDLQARFDKVAGIVKRFPHQTGPRFTPGDRLWVRETCRASELQSGADGVRYIADDSWIGIAPTAEAVERWGALHAYGKGRGKNVPGIHMPRWASRLTLYVSEVRVERLQDLSEADAEAEGVEYETADPPFYYVPGIHPHSITGVGVEERNPRPAAASYAKLWNHINGPGAWEANPWVVAISFRVHAGNIDAAPAAALAA